MFGLTEPAEAAPFWGLVWVKKSCGSLVFIASFVLTVKLKYQGDITDNA
jgi:hypothetical protein